MGDLIDLNSYRRARIVTRIHTAAADIEAVIASGCMHEAVEWIGYPPYQYERCRCCKCVLKQVGK